MKYLPLALLPFLIASASFAETYQCTVNTDGGLDPYSPEDRIKNQIIVEHVPVNVNAPVVRTASSDLSDFPKAAIEIQLKDFVPGGFGSSPYSDRLYQGTILLDARFIPNTLDTSHSPHFVRTVATKGARVIFSQSQIFDHYVNVFCVLQ